MEPQAVQRKLTAILSADVKGYSRLMGEDEVATIRTLTSYREVMSTLIQQHRGRVVDSPGDNLLAEFASVVDAVQCAVEVQREFKAKNAELSQSRRMEFRIGVNLGDVVVEGERIYGDGVNIAARIEGLADGGGICISGTVHDHIENKLDLAYDYLGEKTVKNIQKPVRVYRVRMEAHTTFPEAREELELPDKPSIAVLPFANMSQDPEQEYFSDGITEDLITDLSKISGLFVIARNSVFTYKGKAVKVDQVSQELGVRYILEGSVRKAGNRMRITAQMVDATTGYHLWAERYDREVQNIFALQDEVTQKIVAALEVKLKKDEEKRLVHKETDNPQAYDHYLRGLENLNRFTRAANSQAREMFERSIDLDQNFALAHAGLGWTYFNDWTRGWSQDPESLNESLELAKKAISLNDSLPQAHYLLGFVHLWKRQHELAIEELERVIALDPNGADGHAGLAEVLTWVGRHEEAIGRVKEAMRLNPHYPVWYLVILGWAYSVMEQFEQAIEALERARIRDPDLFSTHIILATVYSRTERMDEARSEVEEIMRISPEFSLDMLRDRVPFIDQATFEASVEALRKAGLS
ncbi:MAG: tetratricopeptide repeat protein [Proteobacteria bacterium]|nr:tetratricopeptide repeat protein [Pseudomonadota bacterium]NIS69312.1 tetratricopeptide repeat protein [Pseudomonadota bacterium]